MKTNDAQINARRRKTIVISLILLIFIVLEVLSRYPNTATPLERLELAASDTAIRLRGGHAPHEDIIIVAIDDESLGWVDERWPWSRSRLADIVNWLNNAGARVIAFDIFLFDASADPAEDEALAQAFANANSVVTVSQLFEPSYSTTTVDRPKPIFLDVIDGYGLTEIERDDDAIVRGVNAYKVNEDEVIFNWAFEITAAYLDIDGPTNPSPASLTFNGDIIPLNQQGRFIIDFSGPKGSYPTYPAAFVPLGDYPPEIFKDKIVFIGASSETTQDLYPTPFSATNLTPGVEVVANTVDNLLTRSYLQVIPPWATILILVGMALIARMLILIPRLTIANILMGILVITYIVAHQIILDRTGIQITIVSPLLMLILGVILPTLEQAVSQEREKQRVRGLFSRFISPQMVNQLLDTQDINSLNKRTELTILFSDIRNFTTLSEQMLPEEVVGLLNPYLAVMSKIIHKHGGTIDKYEGDAIIAFFGEPIPHADHAVRAARAALEMRAALKKLNKDWKKKGIYDLDLDMGIGLNTGEVFVGLIGSEQRINYTVIGDTANLAARLQDQTKELGYPVLISSTTNKYIGSIIKTEFVAERTLKGKSEPVQIYRIV